MSTFNSTIDILSGFGAGHQYATMKMREDEIKQGKNYYNASLLQSGQVGALATVISRISSMTLSGASNIIVQIASEVIPILMIPVNLLIASVKQKNYEDFAGFWNHSDNTCCHILPENLSETSNAIACFLAEHAGDMIRVAMIVGIAVLVVLGDVAFSASALVALTYQIIDQCGLIPVSVSLFLETYLPIISLIGTILGGSLLLRVIALLSLPSYLMPSLHQYLLEKFDHLFRYFLPVFGPTLQEMHAELIEKKELTFDEINQILDAKDDDYEVNPAHGSKPAFDLSKLPQDGDFDSLITLFESIDWTKRYNLIRPRLADDERFIEMLDTKYPKVSKQKFKEQIDTYIGYLAAEKGVTKEQFAADWTREQMGHLVTVLKGDFLSRVKGSQRDLAEAIEDDKRIIAYLKDPLRTRVDLEDALLKIAIEQGAYCARGIKRAANEMRWTIIDEMSPKAADDERDPLKDIERQILQSLEQERWKMVQACYQKFVELLSEVKAGNVVADVHNYDLYRSIFTFGYIPMSAYEKSRFGFLEGLLWNNPSASIMRVTFYMDKNPLFEDKSYLTDVFKKLRQVWFEYIRGVVNINPKLSEKEREEILNRFILNNANLKTEEIEKKFQRLGFFMLGVVQKKDLKPKPKPIFFPDMVEGVTRDIMRERP